MKRTKHILYICLTLCLLISCKQESNQEKKADELIIKDPLPSWNDGDVKEAIIEFVSRVTDPDHTDFVEIEDRIATFDNDGNLWSEQPYYFQLQFAMDRIKLMAADHPEWSSQLPYSAVLEDNIEAVLETGTHGVLELVMTSHAGMTAEEFDDIVANWIGSTRHPRFDRPYNELVYQPMLELLDYLRMNEFKTFIVSGGGVERESGQHPHRRRDHGDRPGHLAAHYPGQFRRRGPGGCRAAHSLSCRCRL